MILDDSFSALDGKTESRVIDNLLRPEGIFRKMGTTVLWITNSSKSKEFDLVEMKPGSR